MKRVGCWDRVAAQLEHRDIARPVDPEQLYAALGFPVPGRRRDRGGASTPAREAASRRLLAEVGPEISAVGQPTFGSWKDCLPDAINAIMACVGRPVSAWAKYADALRRISLACRPERCMGVPVSLDPARTGAPIFGASQAHTPDLGGNRADCRPLGGVVAPAVPAPCGPHAPTRGWCRRRNDDRGFWSSRAFGGRKGAKTRTPTVRADPATAQTD